MTIEFDLSVMESLGAHFVFKVLKTPLNSNVCMQSDVGVILVKLHSNIVTYKTLTLKEISVPSV
jgi:hypothetical protein